MINEEKLEEVFLRPSLKLLRSRDAYFILIFMFREYRNKERATLSESEIHSTLADHLYQNQLTSLEDYDINPLDDYEAKAKTLLKKWLEFGYIKNYPNENGIALYELTSYSVKVLDWIESIFQKREFVGTESRLRDIFDKLRQIIELSDPDIEKRLKDLENQKKEIEDKILEIKITNKIEVFDDYQISSRINEVTHSARELLSDFKEVEENFKTITRSIYQKHTDPNQSKGKILAYTFDALNELKESDQGKSFYAFWDFLIAKSRQEEWKNMIEKLFLILEQRNIKVEDGFLKKMKIHLHRNGQKVYEANDRMAEKLSRVIAEKELSERIKIKQVINEIKELALKLAGKAVNPEKGFEIEGRTQTRMPMERLISFEKEEISDFRINLDQTSLRIDDMKDLEKVFSLITIDRAVLEGNIHKALMSTPVVSLKELTKVFPIEKGLPEVFTYFSISQSGRFKSTFNESKIEDIPFDKEKTKIIRIPQIIYTK